MRMHHAPCTGSPGCSQRDHHVGPCDNEVPCACAILGCKLCACDWKGWNSNYSSCYWSTRSKDYGMVDGGAPSVEVLYSRLSSLTRPSPAILIK